MRNAYQLVREHARAPVVEATNDTTLYYDFVANTDDKWLSFVSDLIANAKYTLGLDELGRILFLPNQEIASLQPIWTYDDNDKSILYRDITLNNDLYNIPNVVEVVYSNGTDHYYYKAVNDDPNSPTSTVNRGRPITHRITNPDLVGDPTEKQIKEYAERILRELSAVECTITYTHGYCPVRTGDCVRINYARAGLKDIKAKVISQNIKCDSACEVTEKAVFTNKFWG
jgi:hypothetical protein